MKLIRWLDWCDSLFYTMKDIIYPILDQWQEGECAFFAVLACLMRMKPVDHEKILEEVKPDLAKIMTIKQAGAWLKRKGYIRNFVPFRYSPPLLPQIPLVARIYRVDWWKTRLAPYDLVSGENNANAHYVCITDEWVCVNSWWEKFADHGYFYFSKDQLSSFSFIHRIIL